MRKTIALLAISGFVLAACASSYNPVVDFQSSSAPADAYDRNLQECQALAEQKSPAKDAAIAGVGGAAAGAALGAITGAFFGGAGRGAAVGAALGGAGGAGAGGLSGVEQQRAIVRNCLRGRGYNVVE